MNEHKSAAWPLALIYGALIVYASLFPFVAWRDQGISPWLYLTAPLPRYWTSFDVVANVLGYVPIGFFLSVALLRGGLLKGAVRLSIGVGILLSLCMETLQVYLPGRVPSNLDLFLNSAGTATGAVCARVLDRVGVLQRWSQLRQTWFVSNARGGLVLLALWPVSLMFPLVVPFGLGQVLQRVQWKLGDWFAGSPWLGALAPQKRALEAAPTAEWLCVLLGLMIPTLIGYAVLRELGKRIWALGGIALLGLITTALSATLSFGPARAWSWLTMSSKGAIVCDVLVSLILLWVPRRACASLAVLGLVVYLGLINQIPIDPYFEQALFLWEQGRFIRFHGLLQWLGWFWPYAALVYVMTLLWTRETKN